MTDGAIILGNDRFEIYPQLSRFLINTKPTQCSDAVFQLFDFRCMRDPDASFKDSDSMKTIFKNLFKLLREKNKKMNNP